MSFAQFNAEYDYANEGTLQGVITEALKSHSRGFDVMLPASIIAYDRPNNVATVQPLIQMVATDGTLLNRAPAQVPVWAPGGGGFLINWPLVAGNQGWVIAADRDISLYLQNAVMGPPNTRRMHSFSDGVFVPDFRKGYTIAGEDAASMVIQNTNGTIKISLWPDRIRVKTPRFDLDSPQINFTSSVHTGPLPP